MLAVVAAVVAERAMPAVVAAVAEQAKLLLLLLLINRLRLLCGGVFLIPARIGLTGLGSAILSVTSGWILVPQE